MANNMGNLVYQVKGNDDIPHWMFNLSNKGYVMHPHDNGIEIEVIDTVGKTIEVPIGDCIVHSTNGLVYTCTKEHADMEGWSY